MHPRCKGTVVKATYWDPKAQLLWWIDIYGPTIHCTDPATRGDRTWTAPEYLGTLSVREKATRRLDASGFYFLIGLRQL